MSEDFNTKGLDQLLKILKQPAPVARVGVLGKSNTRKEKGQTNAEVGYIHEFGIGHPQRSFLRVPIIDNMQKYLKKSGALSKKAMEQIIRDGSMKPFVEKLGILGKRIVLDAFANEGFGKWPAWRTKGYENNTGMILQDTTQLRKSIEWDVK